MLEPVLIAGVQVGGQLTITTDVENYPGFAEVIQGPWLMDQMRMQAEHFGTRIENDFISSMDLSRRPFRLFGDSGTVYTCDALIIATGAEAKWLNLPAEPKFKGFGLSACATCDGFFFKNREVIVVGGGNTAIEDAMFLTRFATKVTIVHRRHEFRAEKILQGRLFANPKIDVIWDSVVEDVIGLDGPPPKVTGLVIRNVHTGERRELRADGVFVAIGHAPATALVGEQLRRKPSGYIWTAPDSTATSVAGVFAAGDVTDETFRQAVTAAGQGCMAALEAERFLAAEEHAPAVAAE
jgi:thioredoxin reductase (NADPH)